MEQPELFPPEKGHIGTDESGKGDYFGPIVIAGVFVPEDHPLPGCVEDWTGPRGLLTLN